MLNTILIVFHSIISLTLIVLILLHAGRGGMSDQFGGGKGPQSAMGSTVVERNLDRMTVAVAITFGITTMLLTWLLG